MPFISVNTTLSLSQEKKTAVAKAIGQKISLIPNKSEPVLMVDISDCHTMFFGGELKEKCAFVDVRCYKAAPFEANKAFTEAVFELLKTELGLTESEIYVSISELPVWGTRGSLK